MSKKKPLSELTRTELRLRLSEAQEELTSRVATKNRASSRVDKAVSVVRKIRHELGLREGVEPTASEHAIVRYLERTGRLDRKEVEAEMITDELIAAMREGCTNYEDSRGFKFKLNPKKYVICTVLSPDMEDYEIDD